MDNRQWHPLVRNGKNVKIKYEKNSERLRNLAARCFYLKYTIKANPSPNGNGFAFNLFGEHKRNQSELTKMNHWRYCYCMAYIAEG